jgi:hypothetical protein
MYDVGFLWSLFSDFQNKVLANTIDTSSLNLHFIDRMKILISFLMWFSFRFCTVFELLGQHELQP